MLPLSRSPDPLMVGAGGAGGTSSSLVSISIGASPLPSFVEYIGFIVGGGGAGGMTISFIFIHCCARAAQSTVPGQAMTLPAVHTSLDHSVKIHSSL